MTHSPEFRIPNGGGDQMCGLGGCPYVVCQAAVGSFVAGWGV